MSTCRPYNIKTSITTETFSEISIIHQLLPLLLALSRQADTIVEPTDEECYTAISSKPAPDLKIEPFEVSMVYGVSINTSIVIPRDMDTILAMANAFKQTKHDQFKMKTKQER